ncbi:MAG: hypothetical protein Q8P18_25465 [Pseudomonadota bacterium]|nr:hypothetical protein [Pseudomonadota bacterium]
MAGPTSTSRPLDPRLVDAVLTALVAVLAVAVVGAGVWAEPGRGLFGDWEHPDMLSNHWVYAWVAERLADGGSLLQNDAYYVPVGDAPFLAGNASGALLSAPFAWAFGSPLGINLYLFLVLFLNVVAGTALARAAGASRRAALVGGVGFGLCPFVLTELSAARLAQVPVWEMAAGLALWIGALERGSWRRALGAGALIGLAGVEYFYYGLFAGYAAGLLTLFAPRRRALQHLRVVAAGAGAAIVTVGPLLFLFVRGWNEVVGASEAAESFPHPFSLQASLPWSWPVWSDVPTMVPAYVSWVLLALGLSELWRRRDRAGSPEADPHAWTVPAFLATAALGWALSLGPYLVTLHGPAEQSHLPYQWIYGLHPALQRFWWPYRHAVLVSLAVAVLAARALGRLLDRLPPRAALVTLGIVLLAVPLELRARGAPVLAATSRIADPLPAGVSAMRALPDGIVVDLPIAPELRIGQQHLTLQAMHGHRLLDGHAMWVDRVRPASWDTYVAASSFLTELARFERGAPIEADPARIDRFVYDVGDIARLEGEGIRWIVVWDEMFARDIDVLPGHLRTLLGALFGTPTIDEGPLTVYDLSAHREDGDLLAPDWDWPKGVSTGDGSSRMTDALPASILVEHGIKR